MLLPHAPLDYFQRVLRVQNLSDHIISEQSEIYVFRCSFTCCIQKQGFRASWTKGMVGKVNLFQISACFLKYWKIRVFSIFYHNKSASEFFNTYILVELDELYLTMYKNRKNNFWSIFELRAPYINKNVSLS